LATQHNNLANFLQVNFAMMYHHHWTLDDLENVTPWELNVYIELIKEHVAKLQAAKAGHSLTEGPPAEMETILKKRAIEAHAREASNK
jgi:hypothetical protein